MELFAATGCSVIFMLCLAKYLGDSVGKRKISQMERFEIVKQAKGCEQWRKTHYFYSSHRD